MKLTLAPGLAAPEALLDELLELEELVELEALLEVEAVLELDELLELEALLELEGAGSLGVRLGESSLLEQALTATAAIIARVSGFSAKGVVFMRRCP